MSEHPKSTRYLWLVVGLLSSALLGVIIYFSDPSRPGALAFVTSLVAGIVTQLIDLRVSIQDLRDRLDAAAPQLTLSSRILERTRADPFLSERHSTLQSELNDLADGTYSVKSLVAVYRDDIRQIQKLQRGEILRSSCPIATNSIAEALEQIQDRSYIRSMREHASASERGVDVRRLYLFRNRNMLSAEMLKHLRTIPKSDTQIRVIFRDKTDPATNIDFLVFGTHTVSTGHIDADTGICDGTKVTQRPDVVRSSIDRFDSVWDIAMTLEEFEAHSNRS